MRYIEKIILMASFAAMMWLVLSISQFMTIQAIREEMTNIVLPMHEPNSLPLSANPNLDTLAWCLNYTELHPPTQEPPSELVPKCFTNTKGGNDYEQ